jgi:hypothetical protein
MNNLGDGKMPRNRKISGVTSFNMNYQLWVNDAFTFAERITSLGGTSRIIASEPLSIEKIGTYRFSWPNNDIPRELVEFWSTGCSQLRFEYTWNPKESHQNELNEIFPNSYYLHGGASILHPRSLYPGNWLIDDNNNEMREELGETAFGWWKESAIFHCAMSGDCLALDCNMINHDPPVLYLSQKDASSKIISSSFSGFLNTWAQLCYLSPETFLGYWEDASTGLLNEGLYMTQKLHNLFSS